MQPFQFNVMHILPSSKIPFEKVPLDVLIATKLTYKKKAEKKVKDNVFIQGKNTEIYDEIQKAQPYTNIGHLIIASTHG